MLEFDQLVDNKLLSLLLPAFQLKGLYLRPISLSNKLLESINFIIVWLWLDRYLDQYF